MRQDERSSAAGRWLRYGLILVFAAALTHFFSICAGIVHAAAEDQTRPADAIVVFGAAEYSGRPSPVYRARLDHAFDLFRKGVAPVVITTGGAAADPSFSEGGVGHDYLMGRGIPDASLIAETQGTDTAQSAERVAVIMRANHMRTCVAVSDAYHVFRIRKLLQHEKVQVYISPRPDSRPHTARQRAEAVMREAASYLVWRLQVTM
ncbi:MAG: YdcF family protein [Terriglobales bacterium]